MDTSNSSDCCVAPGSTVSRRMRQRTFVHQHPAEGRTIRSMHRKVHSDSRRPPACRQLAFHSGTTRRTDLGDQRNLLNSPLLLLVVTKLGGTKRWTGTGLKETGKRRRAK